MQNPNFKITFETEPFVKLDCIQMDCLHNLANNGRSGTACCNLKYISINKDGNCGNFSKRENDSDY